MVTNLTDSDKAEVYAALQNQADILRNHDWPGYVASRVHWLCESARDAIPRAWYSSAEMRRLAIQEKGGFGRIRAVRVALADDLRFLVGSRLIRVETKAYRGGLLDEPTANVILAETAPAEREPRHERRLTYGDQYVYVAKFGDTWKVFAANYLAMFLTY